MIGTKLYGKGQVYAVMFSDGWIKIGRGRDASKRINSHISVSKIRGAKPVKSIISGELLHTHSAEKRLKDYCACICTERHGGEWFKGVCIEKVSEIIRVEFPGDDQEEIMKAISEQAERIKTGFSYEFLEEDRIQKLSDRDEKWATSMSHATVMKSMYTNWMYGGDLFMPIDNGASKFELFSALALYSMSTEEIGDAYVTISDDPDEGISFLMSASQKSAKAILDSKKIEPEKALEVPA